MARPPQRNGKSQLSSPPVFSLKEHEWDDLILSGDYALGNAE